MFASWRPLGCFVVRGSFFAASTWRPGGPCRSTACPLTFAGRRREDWPSRRRRSRRGTDRFPMGSGAFVSRETSGPVRLTGRASWGVRDVQLRREPPDCAPARRSSPRLPDPVCLAFLVPHGWTRDGWFATACLACPTTLAWIDSPRLWSHLACVAPPIPRRLARLARPARLARTA